LSLAEPIRVYMAATLSPPQSDPAKRKFLRPRAIARSAPLGSTVVDLEQAVFGITR
jgi:hypothetical protein